MQSNKDLSSPPLFSLFMNICPYSMDELFHYQFTYLFIFFNEKELKWDIDQTGKVVIDIKYYCNILWPYDELQNPWTMHL